MKYAGDVLDRDPDASHPSRGAWIEISPPPPLGRRSRSHPSRGAWIEIRRMCARLVGRCRTPHGVRGLKFGGDIWLIIDTESHPSRGAWIEMQSTASCSAKKSGRTPHGVRGLKSRGEVSPVGVSSRTPHGVRGLKCPTWRRSAPAARSHPSRGAWIEIYFTWRWRSPVWSHPSRGAWIEILSR